MSLTEQEILNRLSVTRLPTVPQILLKLLELCQNDEVGTFELAKLIEQEPTLANKILSLANSPAFQRNRQKIRLEQSLIALGTDMVQMLIINDSIFQNFSNFSAFKNFDLRSFWQHSLMAALIARNIAKKWNYQNIDEAYLGGLVHDIGRIALLVAAPEESAQKYTTLFYLGDHDHLLIEETNLLKINHAEAGAWLIERWKMDSALADSILRHHDPLENINYTHPLFLIIHLANALADIGQPHFSLEKITQRYRITEEEVTALTLNVTETVQQTAQLLGMDLSNLEPPIVEPPIKTSSPAAQLNKEMHSMMQASEFSRYFSGQKNAADLYNAIIQSGMALFNLETALLLWHHPFNDILTGVAADNNTKPLIGFNIPLNSDNLITNITRKKEPVFIFSALSLTGSIERTLISFFGNKSIIAIPIADRQQFYGILIGGVSTWQLTKLQDETRLLQDFGTQIALAWEKIQENQLHIQQEVEQAEEKYRSISKRAAQEVNNPLSIIKNYLHILNKNLERQESSQNLVAILNEEIDRVSEIIREMANPSLEVVASSDINEVIREVGNIFTETQYAPVSIRITEHIPGDANEPMLVTCPANLLTQVLVNLVRNAIETLPEGGEVTIANKGKVVKDGCMYVGVAVSDTGTGISQEIPNNIFFEDKSKKGIEHYGLGLSIVHSLIEQIQGQITFHSDTDGTVFNILFPMFSPLT